MGKSALELEREARIAANKQRMLECGLLETVQAIATQQKPRKRALAVTEEVEVQIRRSSRSVAREGRCDCRWQWWRNPTLRPPLPPAACSIACMQLLSPALCAPHPHLPCSLQGQGGRELQRAGGLFQGGRGGSGPPPTVSAGRPAWALC